MKGEKENAAAHVCDQRSAFVVILLRAAVKDVFSFNDW